MANMQFYDIIGANASQVPLVRGTLVAYYNTGTGIVPETAAQIAAAKAAGMGVVLIDQWPGDTHFALGLSDILDVENGAATTQDAINGVKAREAKGLQSTIYISQSALAALDAALRAAGCDMSRVFYGVANYSLSLSQAESLLMENPQWAYVQFGDPGSNPATLIPGTNVTLSQVNADIDVANAAWAAQFFGENNMITLPGIPGQWLSVNQYFDKNGTQFVIGLGTTGLVYMTVKPAGGSWSTPAVL